MHRPKVPDGLHISVSQAKQFLMCPRKYGFHYILREDPAFVPIALAFGSAFHEALAAFYQEVKVTREPLGLDLMLDVFRSAWERAIDGPVPLQPDEDESPQSIVDKGVAMLQAFYDHAGKTKELEVEAVEHGFTITLHDPDSGEPLEEQLVGTMDLIVREGEQRVVVEHKSAARKYTADQLRFDVQPTAYKLAAREGGLGEVALRYQVVTKTKSPVVQVADIERTESDEKDFLRIATGVLRAVDAGVSYPVRGWQCRSCPYAYACV